MKRCLDQDLIFPSRCRASDVAMFRCVSSGKQLRVFPAQGQVTYAVFSPDGRHIAIAAANKIAQIWDAESGALIETLSGHTDALVDGVGRRDRTHLECRNRRVAAYSGRP